MASLHFSLVMGSEDGEGSRCGPPFPGLAFRVGLGHVLAAWEAGSANQGKTESCRVVVPVRGVGASLMDRHGFLR